jgi:hypothetical protein
MSEHKDSAASKKVTEFTIDRSKWCRGQGSTISKLLNAETGKMCCLGFYACVIGFKPEEIAGIGSPDVGPPEFIKAWREKESANWLFKSDSSFGVSDERSLACSDLMLDNDSTSYTSEAIREEDIARTFAQNGVIVKFVDKA